MLETARADLGQVEFFRWPTDRGWMRDSGPIFVCRTVRGRRETGHRPLSLQRLGSLRQLAARPQSAGAGQPRNLGLPLFDAQCRGRKFVLEGGGIDVNGRGTLMTTEECYLDTQTQVRNPGLSREDYETALREYLGVQHILWLGHGIAGDDTHGHVDDLCRFVNPTTVVLIQSRDPHDVNYRPLAENRERLQDMRLEDGTKIEIVPLPHAGPAVLARHPAAGQLRQLLHRQRRRAGADVQRPGRPRGAGDPRGTVPGPPGRRHSRRGPGARLRHAALPDPAAARVGRSKSAQFRQCELPGNGENFCRNCADLFRPSFLSCPEQGSWQLEAAPVTGPSTDRPDRRLADLCRVTSPLRRFRCP